MIIIITAPYDGIYLFLLDFMGAGNIQVAIAKSGTGSVLLAITHSDVEQAYTKEVRDTVHSVVHVKA